MNQFLTIWWVFVVSLLGAARLNIFFMGVHFKVAFIFIGVTFLTLVVKRLVKFSYIELFCFFLMLVGGVFSFYSSGRINITIFYIFWMIFNFFAIYGSFKYMACQYGFRFIEKIYIYSFRIQIIISAILYPFLHTYDNRYSLFYYEPSYFSIAAIPYIGFIMGAFLERSDKKSFFDFFLILILLFITKSANLMLILLCFSLLFFLFKKGGGIYFKIKFILSSLVGAALFCFVFISLLPENLIGRTLSKIFESQDLLGALLARTGNRWPRIELVYDVINNVFPFSVGLGNYKYFTYLYGPAEDYSNGIAYLNPIGLPAVNIYLEALVEFGLLGFLGFLILNLYVIKRSFTVGFTSVLTNVLIVSVISLSIESSYLKLSLWALWGVVVGLSLSEREENKRFKMKFSI